MSLNLAAPESGCLLLADISGYTGYLQATELEHAQDVLADLLESLVNTLQPVFKLAKLEGDAAFAYATSSSLSPTMIMDTVEAGYFAFRRRLRDINNSTTCDCNACVLIPSLDLKYFIHFGEFVVRRIAGTEELTGSDVILVHRLMKGTAEEAIGKPAYAAYTSATLAAMGMNPEMLDFLPHTDHFDDIGDVEMFLQDLDMRWAFEQERNRQYVTSAEAELEYEFELPFPRAMVWDYMTNPSKRVTWQSTLDDIQTVSDGRFGVGTTNHCMHGEDAIIEHVADWRPFDYATFDYPNQTAGGTLRMTFEFQPSEGGTTLILRVGPIEESMKEFFVRWRAEFEANAAVNGPALMAAMAAETDLVQQVG